MNAWVTAASSSGPAPSPSAAQPPRSERSGGERGEQQLRRTLSGSLLEEMARQQVSCDHYAMQVDCAHCATHGVSQTSGAAAAAATESDKLREEQPHQLSRLKHMMSQGWDDGDEHEEPRQLSLDSQQHSSDSQQEEGWHQRQEQGQPEAEAAPPSPSFRRRQRGGRRGAVPSATDTAAAAAAATIQHQQELYNLSRTSQRHAVWWCAVCVWLVRAWLTKICHTLYL
jgi:hypothetical protein